MYVLEKTDAPAPGKFMDPDGGWGTLSYAVVIDREEGALTLLRFMRRRCDFPIRITRLKSLFDEVW